MKNYSSKHKQAADDKSYETDENEKLAAITV
jgi:hypothetical protein